MLHCIFSPNSEFETGEEAFEQFIADLVGIPVGPNGEEQDNVSVNLFKVHLNEHKSLLKFLNRIIYIPFAI